MIRRAVPADAEKIAEIYEELFVYEKDHGSTTNWVQGVYPTINVPKLRIPQGAMWVLEENGEVCGSMVLNSEQPKEYRKIRWEYPAEDDKVLVIHTLCIPPSISGRGYGRKMVDFAKGFAEKKGFDVIRIDTYCENEPAKRLYQKNGFRLAGYGMSLHEGIIEEKLAYLEYKPRG